MVSRGWSTSAQVRSRRTPRHADTSLALATARQADHVLVVDDGRAVEQGMPDVLLSAASRFADLVALEEAGRDRRSGDGQ